MAYITSFMPSRADALLFQLSKTFDDATLKAVLQKAGVAIGVAALSAVSDYPTPSRKPLPVIYARTVVAARPYRAPDGTLRTPGSTYLSKFKSMAQQRFVMALVRGALASGKGKRRRSKGGAQPATSSARERRTFPYKRTGTLGKSITYDVRALGRAKLVIVRIGSNVAYAKYVIGKETQAPYHRGVWTPLQDDIARARAAIGKAGVDALRRAIADVIVKGGR